MPITRTAAAAAALALLSTPALAADPVEGLWMVQAGTAKVRVAPCAADKARMCGQIAWLKNAAAKDANNPDESLRGRPVLGLLMIRDFKSSGPGKWTGGKIYDPKTGRTYDASLEANGGDTLKVRGCMGPLCQTQTWVRSN